MVMNIPLISIIVPVYNVNVYLDKCLQSLISQTYTNIEIIVIDDGSTDGSENKCDNWKNKDPRIKVIHKSNAGLGMARNTGIEIASGDYIVFIDSDDFISSTAIEILYLAKLNYEADTIFCGWYRYFNDNKIIEYAQKYQGCKFKGTDVIGKVLLEMIATLPTEPVDSYLYMSVWHGLYSMNIIRDYNIRFPSERVFISEDIIFHIDYLVRSKTTAFIGDNLYFYTVNFESLSSVYNPKRFENEVILYNEINTRLKNNLDDDIYYSNKYMIFLRTQRMFLGRVRSCIMRAYLERSVNTYEEIAKICWSPIVISVIKEYPYTKNPLRQKIFNICLRYKIVPALYFMAAITAKKNLRS
jgi:glycosyltransferase involved in cell wall biosynthesis